MPKRFRTLLGEEFIIARGLGCLRVFPSDYVNQKLAVQINSLGTELQSLFDPDIIRLTRHFFSDMVTATTDSQNRVQLTLEHRKYAGIEDEIVICGCGNFVELWSPEALEAYWAENGSPEKLMASAAALIPVRLDRGLEERNELLPQGGSS